MMKRMYADLAKVEDQDDGSIKVFGYASSGAKDSDGETVTPDAMKAALPGYMKWGAVREMHQPKAAGTAIEARVEDDGRTWFGAHIVDSEAVKKVKAGVYKGFSVGGKVTERDELVKTLIKGISLVEVSLVDRPANPEAVIALWKGEGLDALAGADAPSTTTAAEDAALAAVDALAALLNKGTISPTRLVELANDELAKASAPPASPSSPGEATPSAAPTGADPVAADPAPLVKGMYGVAQFAQLLQAVAECATSAKYEADYEGDNSPLPAQLNDWLKTGAGIFAAMAVEESTELLTAVQGMAAKYAEPADLTKVEAPAADDTLAKALSAARAAAGIADDADLVDAVTKLADERAQLTKRVADLERLPAPGKAFLMALSKGQDATPDLTTKAAESELPATATPEERAMFEIKKAHRAGGIPFHQFV